MSRLDEEPSVQATAGDRQLCEARAVHSRCQCGTSKSPSKVTLQTRQRVFSAAVEPLPRGASGAYNVDMQVTSGKVVGGRVELESELPEGAEVTVLARDSEETFEADSELEAVLLESIAQGQHGERISAEALLREMRSRE